MRKPTTADLPYLPFPFNVALRKPRPDAWCLWAGQKERGTASAHSTGLGRFSRFMFLKLLAFPFIVEVRFIFFSFTRGKSLFTAKLEVWTPTLGQQDEESLGEFYNRQNVAVETPWVNSSAHCFHPRHLLAKSLLCLVYLLKLFQDYGFFSMWKTLVTNDSYQRKLLKKKRGWRELVRW